MEWQQWNKKRQYQLLLNTTLSIIVREIVVPDAIKGTEFYLLHHSDTMASEVLDYFLGQSEKQGNQWIKVTEGVLAER